jgi:hypothetical protein
VTVSADLAEQVVVEAVQELIAGMRGTATVADGVGEAERELEAREQELDAAVRAFSGLEDVAARQRLLTLREERDRRLESAHAGGAARSHTRCR